MENVISKMTIADFITESDLWNYSKERFELMKECGELSLLAIYAESVDYITENADTISPEHGDMLLVEATDVAADEGKPEEEKKATDVGTKIEAKKDGILQKLWNLIIRGLTSIGKAFSWLWKKITGQQKADEEACDKALTELEAAAKEPGFVDKMKGNLGKAGNAINDKLAFIQNGIGGGMQLAKNKKDKFTMRLIKILGGGDAINPGIYQKLVECAKLHADSGTFEVPLLFKNAEEIAKIISDIGTAVGRKKWGVVKTLCSTLKPLIGNKGDMTTMEFNIADIEGLDQKFADAAATLEKAKSDIEAAASVPGEKSKSAAVMSEAVNAMATTFPAFNAAAASTIMAIKNWESKRSQALKQIPNLFALMARGESAGA